MKRLIIFCTCLILVASVRAADPYAGIATPDPLGDPGTNSATTNTSIKQQLDGPGLNMTHEAWQRKKDKERAAQLQRERMANKEEIAKSRGKVRQLNRNQNIRSKTRELNQDQNWVTFKEPGTVNNSEESETKAQAERNAVQAEYQAKQAQRNKDERDFYRNIESEETKRNIEWSRDHGDYREAQRLTEKAASDKINDYFKTNEDEDTVRRTKRDARNARQAVENMEEW